MNCGRQWFKTFFALFLLFHHTSVWPSVY